MSTLIHFRTLKLRILFSGKNPWS